MKATESWNRYILLSEKGPISAGAPAAELLGQLPRPRSMGEPEPVSLDVADGREVTVVDTVHPEGPRLVEADHEIAETVNRGDSPLQMVPLVEFSPPKPALREYEGPAPAASHAGAPAPPTVRVEVVCTDAVSGNGVEGARVIAIDESGRAGAAMTDAGGTATLALWSAEIALLFVEPPESGAPYWGAFRYSVHASGPVEVEMTPIDLAYVDSVRHYYGNSKFDGERGVEIGVIDTGVGPHTDLNVISGINTVTEEPADEYSDPRGHGTHVAGLIGSGGTPPAGLRGLAPGARLRAYRVFPQPNPEVENDGASNYAIMKAITRAIEDGCDVINLSLGGGPHDPLTQKAVVEARDAGMLVVIATGNDYRSPAAFPSAYPMATAVSAMGRRGTFPRGSLESFDVAQVPAGGDPAEFLATFSNVGQEVTVTGPGVGDLSTLPGDRFGSLSGTSMAAPVVSGAVACLLSLDASVYAMARDGARSEAIEDLLIASCRSLGFGPMYEGNGMPDPALV